jgi:hypothetical protein
MEGDEKALEEFKRSMNAERKRAGARPLYLEP